VETLLAVGGNPNYHNDSANSFALAQSVSADIGVLRAMLDAAAIQMLAMSKASRSFSTTGSWNHSRGNVRNGCVSCSIAEPT
jgi:hypothetical protein